MLHMALQQGACCIDLSATNPLLQRLVRCRLIDLTRSDVSGGGGFFLNYYRLTRSVGQLTSPPRILPGVGPVSFLRANQWSQITTGS